MTYYSRSSSAYDFTLFEDPDMYESGDKAEDIESDGAAEHQSGTNENKNRHGSRADRRNTAKKSGRGGALRITLAVIFGIAFAFIVVSIIHGQVQLTELNQEIANAKTQLAEQQSVYTQLQMKVDSSISTAVVEEYARDNLNMNGVYKLIRRRQGGGNHDLRKEHLRGYRRSVCLAVVIMAAAL